MHFSKITPFTLTVASRGRVIPWREKERKGGKRREKERKGEKRREMGKERRKGKEGEKEKVGIIIKKIKKRFRYGILYISKKF